MSARCPSFSSSSASSDARRSEPCAQRQTRGVRSERTRVAAFAPLRRAPARTWPSHSASSSPKSRAPAGGGDLSAQKAQIRAEGRHLLLVRYPILLVAANLALPLAVVLSQHRLHLVLEIHHLRTARVASAAAQASALADGSRWLAGSAHPLVGGLLIEADVALLLLFLFALRALLVLLARADSAGPRAVRDRCPRASTPTCAPPPLCLWRPAPPSPACAECR
jgi:hypothetical protein